MFISHTPTRTLITRENRPLDDAFFCRLTGFSVLPDRVVLEFREGGRVEVLTSQPILWIEPDAPAPDAP